MIGEILTFPVHADKDGALVALEKGADFPFGIKRVYYVRGASHDFVRYDIMSPIRPNGIVECKL